MNGRLQCACCQRWFHPRNSNQREKPFASMCWRCVELLEHSEQDLLGGDNGDVYFQDRVRRRRERGFVRPEYLDLS
jgi:hypothetical protein